MSLVNPVILQLPLSGHVLAVVCPDVAALVHLFKADWDVVENHRLAVEEFLLSVAMAYEIKLSTRLLFHLTRIDTSITLSIINLVDRFS